MRILSSLWFFYFSLLWRRNCKGSIRDNTPPPHQQLLISCLVYEDKDYIRTIVKNLVYLTRNTTEVVIHVSKSVHWIEKGENGVKGLLWDIWRTFPGTVDLDKAAARRRFHVNPERRKTYHGRGSILKQHLSNIAYARDKLGLFGTMGITHVMMHASTSRLIFPGVETYVFSHNFNTILHQAWLDVITEGTPTHCLQVGTEPKLDRDPKMTSAAHFFCSAKPHFDTPCTGPGPDQGRIEATPCIRMAFSSHEGAFFPSQVILAAMEFYNSTPVDMRFEGLSDASGLRRSNFNLSKPPSLLEWLPFYYNLGGSAAEEIWIQTYLWHTERHRRAYLASDHAPTTSIHWTTRSTKIGICEAMALIKQRNHTANKCDYPLAIKRWGGHHGDSPEIEIWFDCLGSMTGNIIDQWLGTAQQWAFWEAAAESCLVKTNDKTKFKNSTVLLTCDYTNPRVQRSVVKAVFKHSPVPYGKALACLKALPPQDSREPPFSLREWKRRREIELELMQNGTLASKATTYEIKY